MFFRIKFFSLIFLYYSKLSTFYRKKYIYYHLYVGINFSIISFVSEIFVETFLLMRAIKILFDQ